MNEDAGTGVNTHVHSPLATTLVAWHRTHGRHDLPWQTPRTPYRVWVSEIMLQQTQVVTVTGYFQRFMQRFPDVAALAAAPLDEVLHLWAGLGYYSRARNLHRAAQCIIADFGGELPRDIDALMSLPGIGRSTAGAILALGSGLSFAILDGNVKRVLSRYFLIEGSPASAEVTRRLWKLAQRCTPTQDAGTYTQAIMDLGATLCTRRQPLCPVCPLQSGCGASRDGRQHELPTPRTRPARRTRRVVMLFALSDGCVLLQRRSDQGVWGGLWTPPEFDTIEAARVYARDALCAPAHAGAAALETLPLVRHAFTHFDLEITPLLSRHSDRLDTIGEADQMWYDLAEPARVGLPAPVSALLQRL